MEAHDKHKTYRETHRERIRAAEKACYMKHQEEYKAKKRARYQIEKEERLAANKADVKLCPMCHINYKRNYLKKHMMNRHNLGEDQLPADIACKQIQAHIP